MRSHIMTACPTFGPLSFRRLRCDDLPINEPKIIYIVLVCMDFDIDMAGSEFICCSCGDHK